MTLFEKLFIENPTIDVSAESKALYYAQKKAKEDRKAEVERKAKERAEECEYIVIDEHAFDILFD